MAHRGPVHVEEDSTWERGAWALPHRTVRLHDIALANGYGYGFSMKEVVVNLSCVSGYAKGI